MIPQLIGAAVLILSFAGCIYQVIGSIGQGDRLAALTWSGNGLIQVAWVGLLAWGGFWS